MRRSTAVWASTVVAHLPQGIIDSRALVAWQGARPVCLIPDAGTGCQGANRTTTGHMLWLMPHSGLAFGHEPP